MKIELQDLEGKVQALVEMCQRLRAENNQLRQQLATSQNENARLNEKVSVAAERIEALLQSIPESLS
ncbi:MAG: cell division protein ZapB [Neisseriaceae bacterium]|jgi:cell division protein ZapB|nr:MAG: cell division protein ZapB [Neisseriaceae bacterium]